GTLADMERVAAQIVAMQERDVRRVDATFHRLQVVAFLRALRYEPVRRRHERPFEAWPRRLELARAQIGPDHVAELDARIGLELNLPAESRLGRDLDALPAHVKFPAMIGAAQAALLVAPEPQRHAAVGAEFVHQPDPARTVAEGDQPLGQEFHAHRRAIRLGEFRCKECRDPIAPQQPAHRRARRGLRQEVVKFARGHFRWALAAAAALFRNRRVSIRDLSGNLIGRNRRSRLGWPLTWLGAFPTLAPDLSLLGFPARLWFRWVSQGGPHEGAGLAKDGDCTGEPGQARKGEAR